MALHPPGTRKNNRFFILRERIDGRQYEVVCLDPKTHAPTTNKTAAEKFAGIFRTQVLQSGGSGPGQINTVADAIKLYVDTHDVSANDQRYLDKLTADAIAKKPLRGRARIRPSDIPLAANRLYPGTSNATKNRQAIVPIAAALHYAAKNDWCEYMVVEKLTEAEPPTRLPDDQVPALLLANTDGELRALLTLIFYNGWRIGEALSLWSSRQASRSHINMHARELRIYVSKSKKWKTVAMHPLVFQEFANLGLEPDRVVFPWRNRWGVYRALRPVCTKMKVEFTPHMARHWFGTKGATTGATSYDLVNAGTWTSEKSVQRYTHGDIDRARDMLDRLPHPGIAADEGQPRGKVTK